MSEALTYNDLAARSEATRAALLERLSTWATVPGEPEEGFDAKGEEATIEEVGSAALFANLSEAEAALLIRKAAAGDSTALKLVTEALDPESRNSGER